MITKAHPYKLTEGRIDANQMMGILDNAQLSIFGTLMAISSPGGARSTPLHYSEKWRVLLQENLLIDDYDLPDPINDSVLDLRLLRQWAINRRDELTRATSQIDPKLNDQNDSISNLRRNVPAFNSSNGLWVTNKVAAVIESLEVRTLATYRSSGRSDDECMFGIDPDDRIWMRPPYSTKFTHPRYLRSSLNN